MGEDGHPELIKWSVAKARLTDTYGIDIVAFSSASKINELRLVANTVKHADGGSCADLKKIRPDLFVFPDLKKYRDEIGYETMIEVFTPLAGEDVYIGIEDFKKYVEAVKEFWDELAAAFDKYEYPTI
jgi:UDP-N-acetylglucosamine transferase subunit ALG13